MEMAQQKCVFFAPWLCSCAGRRSRPAADRRRTSHESQRPPPGGGGAETTTLAAQLPRQARNEIEIDIETTRSFTKTGSGQNPRSTYVLSFKQKRPFGAAVRSLPAGREGDYATARV
jgi:hypothetical protein